MSQGLPPPIHPVEDKASRSDYRLTPQARKELQEIYSQCLLSSKEARADSTGLTSRISQLESALALYKILPLEILSLIFSFAREGFVYRISERSKTLDDYPRRGTGFPEHVCRLWRQVALSTPAFYQSVFVDYTNYDYCIPDGLQRLDRMTNLAEEIITRGARNLMIDFCRLGSHSSQIFLKRLITQGQRLRKVAVFYTNADPAFVNAMLSLLPQMPLSLRSLTIDVYNSHKTQCKAISTLFKPLHLTSDLPWKNLEHLAISNLVGALVLPPSMALAIFSKCPLLQDCHLKLAGPATNPIPPINSNIGAIHLEKLTTLQLELQYGEWTPPEQFGWFLSSLTLPCLDFLSIGAGYKPVVQVNDLCALFDRSQCKLKTFHLTIGTFPEQDLNRLVLSKAMSTVKRFSLRSAPMYPSVLQKIASGAALPRLRQLTGSIAPKTEATEALLHAARARKGEIQSRDGVQVTQLKTVDFLYRPYFWRDVIEPLPPIPSDLVELYEQAGGWFKLEHRKR